MKHISQFKLVAAFLLLSNTLLAQVDSSWQASPVLKVSGFADVFYVYDLNQPEGAERQAFLFNHNRHNEFNLNLGLLQFQVDHSKYRGNFALQTGTYANDNYAAEPGVLKNIFEANVGISLNDNNSLWLDAGIFSSHLGFESAISMDNFTLTRSLSAESSPYFLSGAKLTYEPNEKWSLVGLVVNGWQRIQRLQGNSLPSFGTQISYSPSKNTTLNWSTFIGTDDPDETRRMRYFNNVYGQFKLSEKFALIAGFDVGAQQIEKNSSNYNFWLTPTLIGQYSINDVWKTAIRVEYYQDETGIIIPTGTLNGFQTTGVSLNFDYSPSQNIVCRLEGRWMSSVDEVFKTESNTSNTNLIVAASMAIKFGAVLSK